MPLKWFEMIRFCQCPFSRLILTNLMQCMNCFNWLALLRQSMHNAWHQNQQGLDIEMKLFVQCYHCPFFTSAYYCQSKDVQIKDCLYVVYRKFRSYRQLAMIISLKIITGFFSNIWSQCRFVVKRGNGCKIPFRFKLTQKHTYNTNVNMQNLRFDEIWGRLSPNNLWISL